MWDARVWIERGYLHLALYELDGREEDGSEGA
jgi:hypothetical protein